MDTNSFNIINFSILQNDNNFLDLEQQSHRMIERLKFLETQVKESHAEMQKVTFSKMELERTLEKEKRELVDTKAQLKIIRDTMQNWEQERIAQRDTFVAHSLQLESLTNECNSYKELTKSLKIENMELKLKVEEIQKQLQSQNQLENLLHSKNKIMETVLEKIYGENQKMEKDIFLLKKKVTVAKYFGEQMITALKHHHSALNKAYEENESLKQSQIILEKELQRAKNTINEDENIPNTINDKLQELRNKLKEREEIISTLHQKQIIEIEEKKQLHENLKIILEEQIKFNNLETYLKNRISELEQQLKRNEYEMK